VALAGVVCSTLATVEGIGGFGAVSSSGEGGSMANILVVDDDLDIVELVKSMLTPKHNVQGATDSTSALEVLRRDDIQLLITDVRMPNVNGFILINQAKKLKPDLNVIIISAYYDENDEIARQVVRRYADTALSKPLRSQTVNEVVDQVLAS
jgi:DNA-binding NtrC family response regulator